MPQAEFLENLSPYPLTWQRFGNFSSFELPYTCLQFHQRTILVYCNCEVESAKRDDCSSQLLVHYLEDKWGYDSDG